MEISLENILNKINRGDETTHIFVRALCINNAWS